MVVRTGTSLLDVAVEVLVADPAASLAAVAEAAGMGRTTLHKHYATRDDLMRAVAHRAIDRWEEAIEAAEHAGASLQSLAKAMVPIGPHLAFLWRNPIFDHVEDINGRWAKVEPQCLTILRRAQDQGDLRADVPEYWLLQTFYSLVYVAAESVQSGHLARRDAPARVVDTLRHGLGAR
jgi:AcrR family transcriptional regulator